MIAWRHTPRADGTKPRGRGIRYCCSAKHWVTESRRIIQSGFSRSRRAGTRYARLVKLETTLRSARRPAADSSQDHDRIMAGAILYGLTHGIRSSRRLEWACGNAVDFMWLVEGRTIDHSTFCDFRTKFQRELKDLFGDSVSGHTLPAELSDLKKRQERLHKAFEAAQQGDARIAAAGSRVADENGVGEKEGCEACSLGRDAQRVHQGSVGSWAISVTRVRQGSYRMVVGVYSLQSTKADDCDGEVARRRFARTRLRGSEGPRAGRKTDGCRDKESDQTRTGRKPLKRSEPASRRRA